MRSAFVLLLTGFVVLLAADSAMTSRLVDPQLRSQYVSLAEDAVASKTTTLLSTQISLVRRDSVFVDATGTVGPAAPATAGSLVVTFDGKPVTSTSTIDWRESFDPVRRTFDVVGATHASVGRHTVNLVAKPTSGSLATSATSNLSVLVHPARTVVARALGETAGPFDFRTYGTTGEDTPHRTLLRASVDGRLKTIAFGSVSAIRAGHDGDAMIGIYRNGVHPNPAASLWSVNDICTCAETQAPLFTQAVLESTGRKHSVVSLDASEFPWWTSIGENPASYSVEPGARLVVLNGLHVAGSAPALADGYADLRGTATDYWCLASDQGWPDCASVGTDVLVAQGVLNVARGASGVVMFAAKSRVQADNADAGGIVSMWLTVDGVRVGATGIQELRSPSSVSERTIATSYLAAGSARLQPGRHIVRLYARADGSFIHVSLVRDLPLVWFD